ncbi:MAG: retroviral-like aspartic protease family protein [Muribaculaceae bacterium]|nr:retroviral-like aspartic protease family protein [Muribaculaceae bacterium]
MYRLIILLLTAILPSLPGNAKSYDKELVKAINSGDWFGLDSIYRSIPKNSVSDFLDVYSRCLIGYQMNRSDVSLPAFAELFDKHSSELSSRQKVNSASMFSMVLSRVGDNARAASVLSSVLEAEKEQLEPGTVNRVEQFVKQYSYLSDYKPYAITFGGESGCVPFRIVPGGRPEHNGRLMCLENSYINGIEADITFDTGAGVNVISDSLVDEYNLIPFDVETRVSGAATHGGTYAIARELRLGDITVRDVPFYVMNITSNNAEADQYMKTLGIIVGSELMLQLKDLTIVFVDGKITVPVEAPHKTDVAPNMCFSSGMNLLARGSINGTSVLMNVDTGDVTYGTLGSKFYKQNKKYIKSKGEKTTIRRAGIGGVNVSDGYKVTGMSLDLGGNNVNVPEFTVMPKMDPFGYECNLGLKSLMLYKKVRFNLVDFVLTTVE